jgi:SAM-dependent methyltransferase
MSPSDDAADAAMDPQRVYDRAGEREWTRHDRNPVNRLAFDATREYLREHLPPEGHVLDAGGGAGRYAAWLASEGYEVTLVDLSAEQCRVARENLTERGLDDRVRVVEGDVRDLPVDGPFDAVCSLGGPLSHVLDADDRRRALAGFRERLPEGAPVVVSVLGRLAALQAIVRNSPAEYSLLTEFAAHGDYTADLAREHGVDPEAVPFAAHYFRADEFEAELTAAGLTVERLVGLEGPATNGDRDVAALFDEGDPDALDADLRAVSRELREDRAVVDWANHLLAVART